MRPALESLLTRAAILWEFLLFLWRGRLWWMLPIALGLLLLWLLALLGPLAPVAPLIYPLF